VKKEPKWSHDAFLLGRNWWQTGKNAIN